MTRRSRARRTADEPDAPTDGQLELTLEELSERSGVSARTIRYYQSQRLLARPGRDRVDARVARYGPDHLERLQLIGQLRDRGLKLPAIRALLDQGNVSDWLGLDATLRGTWGDEAPRLLTEAEMSDALVGMPPGTLARLEEAGLVVRQGDTWLLPAPGLFELTTRLVGHGLDTELVLKAGRVLQRHLGRAADELVELFTDSMRTRRGDGPELDSLVDALQSTAGDAARTIFAREIERAVAAALTDTRRLPRR